MAASSSRAIKADLVGVFAEPGALFVAALLASAGLWWFRHILKDIRRLPPVPRYGVYAAIWLAYFFLVMILAARTAPAP